MSLLLVDSTSSRVRGIIVASAAVLGVVCGCSLFNRKPSGSATQFDRLMKAYPEMRSGRFAVIADFEDPAHMDLVQFISVSSKSSCGLDHRRGRPATGRSCVALTCGSDADTLVLNNEHAEDWYLKRNWRGFDLLLMSIHTPQPGLRATIQIAAGSGPQRLTVESSIPLNRDWNTIRLDLAEIGEHLPLDDVQEIRIAFLGMKKPIRVAVDDIVLVGNRRDLFGDSKNESGELYVQQVGRRWNIGAGGRFELTLANGQIVQWYNLAEDPYRLQNLVQGTTLGPSPVALHPPDPNDGDFAGFGTAVIVHPQLLEMNRVRIVLASEWRYVDQAATASIERRPFQRWVYTVYPTGQLYAGIEFTANTAAWSPGPLGLAVTMAVSDERDMQTYTVSNADAASGAHPIFARIRNQPADSCLLFVPAFSDPLPRFVTRRDKERRRVSMVAVRPMDDREVDSWACHLRISGNHDVSDEESAARALAYQQPDPPRLELGSFVRNADGRTISDGFDPAAGCWVIAPDRGRVRLYVDGRKQPAYTPAFQIINTENRQAQVYVNHIVFDRFDYDANRNVVFQLPETIRDDILIEVLFRRSPNIEGS